MEESNDLINKVVTEIKQGNISLKDIIKLLVPSDKKAKKTKTKEEVKAYRKEWYLKNRDYVLTKVKTQTEEKKRQFNELRQKCELLEKTNSEKN